MGSLCGAGLREKPVSSPLKGVNCDAASLRPDYPVFRNSCLRVLPDFRVRVMWFIARRDNFNNQVRRPAFSLAHAGFVLVEPYHRIGFAILAGPQPDRMSRKNNLATFSLRKPGLGMLDESSENALMG